MGKFVRVCVYYASKECDNIYMHTTVKRKLKEMQCYAVNSAEHVCGLTLDIYQKHYLFI